MSQVEDDMRKAVEAARQNDTQRGPDIVPPGITKDMLQAAYEEASRGTGTSPAVAYVGRTAAEELTKKLGKTVRPGVYVKDKGLVESWDD